MAEAFGQLLFEAAVRGDAIACRDILEKDSACVTFTDGEGVTPLMAAAEGGHLTVVHTLLDGGVPWNALDNDGYCAGEYAAKHPDVAEALLHWGVQAELVLGAAEREARRGQREAANAAYLKQRLVYAGDRLLDADGEAVMMGWEAPLMERHAAEVAARGGHVLNVGFGLGLVDEAIQRHSPASHTIVEAHPDVHAHMLAAGWGDRPGVRILFGRWQDVLPRLADRRYEGVFFDTYGEGYEDVREFHAHLPSLLAPEGVYSFFNGFCPDNLFLHLVYGRLIQVELAELGLTTTYQRLPVATLSDEVWRGVANKYWHLPAYFLPVCTWPAAAAAAAAAAPGDEGGGAPAATQGGGDGAGARDAGVGTAREVLP